MKAMWIAGLEVLTAACRCTLFVLWKVVFPREERRHGLDVGSVVWATLP